MCRYVGTSGNMSGPLGSRAGVPPTLGSWAFGMILSSSPSPWPCHGLSSWQVPGSTLVAVARCGRSALARFLADREGFGSVKRMLLW
jgi:hypothetical protein